jgi:hypothetical protein
MDQYKSRFLEEQKFEGLTKSQAVRVNSNINKAISLVGEAGELLEKAESSEDKRVGKLLKKIEDQLRGIKHI